MQHRADKLAHQLRNEISYIISRELKDPRIGFATITTVRVTPDLRAARIFISVLGTPEEQQATLAALQRATSFIRRQIAGRLRLRHTPEIQFKFDDSIEYGAKMDALIEEIRQELPDAEAAAED